MDWPEKIQWIEKAATEIIPSLSKELPTLATNYAEAEAEYDKALGLVTARLEGGESFMVDDVEIKHTSVTTLPAKAKTVCWKERFKLIQAVKLHQAQIHRLSATQSALTGMQSVLKFHGGENAGI